MDHGSMSEYMAHGYCLLWEPSLIWLHVISDILTGLAYFSIPVASMYFLFKRRDFPFTGVAIAFVLIFLSCGTTHFFAAYIIYTPAYWQEGYVKAATALISIVGAIMFIPMIPKALSLPSLQSTLQEIKGLNNTLEKQLEEQKIAEKALAESEFRLRTLLQTIPDLIWLKNPDGVYLSCNAMVERLIGTKEADIVGRTDYDFFDKEVADFHREYDRELLTTGKPNSREEWVTFADDGHKALMHIIKTPMHDVKGNLIGILGIAHDITDRKESEEEIKRLNSDLVVRNDNLEVANKELEAFSYSVAHGLRAPLRHIHGFSNLLMKDIADKLDEKGKLYFSRILDDTEKMSRLIDDLLHLSSISRQELRRQSINLSEMALSIISDLRTSHPDRDVEVSIKGGLTAFADAGLVEIVLSNLLGNAWKFTSKTDHACIEFGTTEQDGKIIYYIRDNGVGFDEKYAGKMFWPFHRLHAEDAFEGTGIGLAIADRIVRLHAGKIWAEGAEGRGATISFSLT